MGEASKRLQRERRDKIHEWEERLSSFDSFLRKAERETERLEPIGDDLETVKRQNEDFEVRYFIPRKGFFLAQNGGIGIDICHDFLAQFPL